jgi:hypothetical protein
LYIPFTPTLQLPTWLDLAHEKLDRAVFDIYGWPHDLRDEEILGRLLALNLERAQEQVELHLPFLGLTQIMSF